MSFADYLAIFVFIFIRSSRTNALVLFKLNVHCCPADRVLDVIIRDDLDAELADGVLARMREQLLVIRRANASSMV